MADQPPPMRPETQRFVRWEDCPDCRGLGALSFLPDGGPNDMDPCERCDTTGRIGHVPLATRLRAWAGMFSPVWASALAVLVIALGPHSDERMIGWVLGCATTLVLVAWVSRWLPFWEAADYGQEVTPSG